MATSYSTLLGLALPVQGELSGTWGDTVNNYITNYLDSAVAGTQTLSTDANVTLTKTTGTTLGATSSQYALINLTGARTAQRTVTVPAASKQYYVINSTTGGFATKFVGAGPTTGITIAAGESAIIAWNGSDFVKVALNGGAGSYTTLSLSGQLTSTVATGTAPFVVASTTNVANLNASSLNGATFAAPGAIGSTTASSGAFTTLSASGNVTLGDASTDTLNVGNGDLIKDASGNLGIGTSSPAGKVDSVSNAYAAFVARSSTSGVGQTVDALKATDSAAANFANAKYSATAHIWNYAGATEGMRLDTSGNFGLGVVPSAWGAAYKSIDQAGASIFSSNTGGQSGLAQNAYNNGTNWTYKTTAAATLYQTLTGQHIWYTAASGTAGNTITFTQAMTLDASSQLTVQTAIGAGGTPFSGVKVYSTGTGHSVATVYGFRDDQAVQSASTTYRGYFAFPSTQATAFTLTSYEGFHANLGTIGAGSAITTAAGFIAAAALGGAGTAYGVQSLIAAGTNKWNIYASGTANNAFAGNVRIGSTTAPTVALDVTGAIASSGVTSAAGFQSTSTSTNSTGSGVEILGGASGVVQAYNRTGSAYINMVVDGATVNIKSSGTSIGLFTSTGLAVTGAVSATTSAIVGTAATSNTVTVNGINSGTAAGANLTVQNNASPVVGIGNYSNIIGGAYDATATLYASSAGFRTYIGGLGVATTLDTSGNLGLGVTPSAWRAGAKALQLGATGYASLFEQADGSANVSFNAFESGTNTFTYRASTFASKYGQVGGTHTWYTAPSGTAGNAITFTQAMTLDASGNLGLGVAPSAWNGIKAFEFGTGTSNGSLYSLGNDTNLSTNAYYNAGFKYVSTATAARYQQSAGQHIWYTAGSGTAGNAITFTQAMTLDNSGNLTFQSTGSAINNVTSFNGGQLAGLRNRIINGGMVVNQRNSSVTQSAVSQYVTDRFAVIGTVASAFSSTANAAAPTGFKSSLYSVSNAATTVTTTDWFNVFQRIEGNNITDLAWGTASAKTVTLSFWVRCSLTGTFGGSVTNGSLNRSYPFSYTISAANTWEQKTITIPGDTSGTWATDSTTGIQIGFSLGAGDTFSGTAGAWAAANYYSATGATNVVSTNAATFYVTGVQLELGSVATPFEQRPYGMELALCQRYYEIGTLYYEGYCPAATYGSSGVNGQFAVVKRATPTVTYPVFTNIQNAAVGAIRSLDAQGIRRYAQCTAAGALTATETFTASAEL